MSREVKMNDLCELNGIYNWAEKYAPLEYRELLGDSSRAEKPTQNIFCEYSKIANGKSCLYKYSFHMWSEFNLIYLTVCS